MKAVCKEFGVSGPQVQLLRLSSHATFKVSDKFVARVKSDAATETLSTMQKEIDLCHFLAAAGASVTHPTQELPCGPHVYGSNTITFWNYESEEEHRGQHLQTVETLQVCHKALESYPKSLPSYLEAISRCFDVLNTEKGRQFLSGRDYSFLRGIYPELISGLTAASKRVLHGDCHLGNVLHTARGPIWTDFEAACSGPIEWDLTCLPDDLRNAYRFNPDLFHKLSLLRSWCVAVWCWIDYDKSIEKREAADYYLQRVRKQMAGRRHDAARCL